MRTFVFNWTMNGTTTIQAETQEEAERMWMEEEAPGADFNEDITRYETLECNPVLEIVDGVTKEVGFLHYQTEAATA